MESVTFAKSYKKIVSIHNAIKHDMGVDVIRSLLETEGDINEVISENQRVVPNLLFTACGRSNETFDLLLDYGADFTAKNEKGATVLHECIPDERDNWLMPMREFYNYIDSVVTAHKKFNVFSNPADENGITHFHVACMTKHASVVEFFLKNGVDVNHAVNANSPIFPFYSPLHFAVDFARSETVEVLLKYGANVFNKNAEKLNPIHVLIGMCTKWLPLRYFPEYEATLIVFLKFAISDTNSIEVCDEYGISNLHVVCLVQDESLMESVLVHVTNVNQPVNFDSPIYPGYTPLHFAALSSVRNFMLLVNDGADIEAKNAKGETPFDLFLQKPSVADIYDILLTKEQWRSIVLSDNKTKLIDLISTMKDTNEFISLLNCTESLVDIFVPLHSPLWPGYTLLHLVIMSIDESRCAAYYWGWKLAHYPIIDACLDRGADMTVKDARGWTALQLAFYMKKPCVVVCLLDRHDKLDNPADENNLSHFHIACASRHLKAVEHFLSIGVDVNSPVFSTFEWVMQQEPCRIRNAAKQFFFFCSGSTPLHLSVANGNSDITKMLLKRGADVNVKDVNGFTPVHRLLPMKNLQHKEEILDLLLSDKNLKNCVTHTGLSHLHIACHCDHYKAVEKLIKAGADVNALVTYKSNKKMYGNDYYFFDHYGDPDGTLDFLNSYSYFAPLDFAMFEPSYGWNDKISHLLINHGADFSHKNAKGVSYLNCLSDRNIGISALSNCVALQRYFKENFGMMKLHLACCTADVRLAEHSISHGANVNAKISSNCPIWQGYTPLHIAAVAAFEKGIDNKLKRIVKLLTKNGADLTIADDNYNTPFHIYLTKKKSMEKNESKIISVTNFLFSYLENYNVNTTNLQGLSLFHIACLMENVTSVKKFLKHGVVVNQAISYLSDIHPGGTPLHLAIKYYCSSQRERFLYKIGYSDKFTLQIVDLLIQNNANLNASNAVGDTPLFGIIRSTRLRRIWIRKLISNGVDIHATNLKGITPFELLLSQSDVTWKEIELFLKAGCSFDFCNPVTQEGCMAIAIFHHHGIRSTKILNNPILHGIITNPKINEVNDAGCTVIHNVVPLKGPYFTGYAEVLEQLVEQLTMRGCDIDHQDNQGSTALHLAVKLMNFEGISGLLENGADVNLIDKNGKIAHEYVNQDFELDNTSSSVRANVIVHFSIHVCKLQSCALRVSEVTERLQAKLLNKFPLKNDTFASFREDIEKTKSVKIGTTLLSLYEFLTGKDMDVVYKNMTSKEREEVDKFFEKINKRYFPAIYCVLKLKYRQTIERVKLIGPALTSLSLLSKCQLPDLCCQHITSFLKNEDLKRLIASRN